ncbi:MAG: hypothetical protein H7Y06_01090 [Opitutaceae bacterium]|nr:hypothetical protein [Opitutaceae bacterium]
MQKIIQNLELVLTAAGLLVIFGVHFIFDETYGGSWMIAAVTAIAVGIIHGLIFWLVRRRQHHIRRRALAEAKRMLKDIVNNQLCVIQFSADLQNRDHAPIKDAHARITASVGHINAALNEISEESLDLWKKKYPSVDTETAKLNPR